VTAQGPHFTPIVMGFTLTQSSSALVTDTLVSRSLSATFSELIGQPTPPELRVPIPTIAALVIGTTETISSSVASSKPPQIVTPTLEASATAIEADVAPLPIVTPLESHATPVTEPTQTASPSLLAQSSGSEDDAAQF